MIQLWQLWKDINDKWNSQEVWDRRQQIGDAFIATGHFIKGDSVPEMGAHPDAEGDFDEAISQVSRFVESQGVAVPMAAGGDRRAQLLELLKIALPLLLKLL